MERVALVSENFRNYSFWDGEGTMDIQEKERIMAVTAKAHAWGKLIRFWGNLEGVLA